MFFVLLFVAKEFCMQQKIIVEGSPEWENEPLWRHIILGSERYFKYNPHVNEVLRRNIGMLNVR